MSRRFKSRHHKVIAQPDASPVPWATPSSPIALDDSNSYVNPTQSDCRIPLDLDAREYRTAESTLAAEKSAAAAAAADEEGA
jgi:hypothetical protein